MDPTTIPATPAMPVLRAMPVLPVMPALPVMPVLPGSILEVFFTRFMPGFYSPAAGPPSVFFSTALIFTRFYAGAGPA